MDKVIWFSPGTKRSAELSVKPTRVRLNPLAVNLLGDILSVDIGYDTETETIVIRKGLSYAVSRFKFERKGGQYAIYADIGGPALVKNLKAQGVMPGRKYKLFLEKGLLIGYPDTLPRKSKSKPTSRKLQSI